MILMDGRDWIVDEFLVIRNRGGNGAQTGFLFCGVDSPLCHVCAARGEARRLRSGVLSSWSVVVIFAF